MATAITSVSGVLSLLDENQNEINEYALTKLNELVGEFWAEIASSIGKIEVLYESEDFPARKLAALVASKVYYHLEQYPTAMNFALGAGELFDVSKHSEYVDTLVAKCIDEYIRLRVEISETKDKASAPKIDARLENIVLGMFDRCFRDKQYKQALGIALETRRLDKIEQAISGSDNVEEMLSYCLKTCLTLVLNKQFRQTVLELLVKLYNQLKVPAYLRMCETLVFLDDSKRVAEILIQLLKSGNDEKILLAYQIGFDLVNNASQHFLNDVRKHLPVGEKPETSSSSDAMDVEQTNETTPLITQPSSIKEEKGQSEVTSSKDSTTERFKRLSNILSGETTIMHNLDFLFRNNKTDLLLLKNIKTATESRVSLLHSGTIYCNAFMHAGTTVDSFLHENLEWLSRATNWAKFSAIAGLGVIHKGHLKEAFNLLSNYLPQPNSPSSAYAEGGALYALGLIHASFGQPVIQYLITQLKGTSNEIVQHGACLGLGVAAMASGNETVYDALKEVLWMDSAVAGEAAGIAMGLTMLGTASKTAIDEMLNYAHETQHEKIIRGLAIGLSLVMYAREEEADTFIEQLLLDKDPILRYGAMYTIGMAYSGTSNNNAIRRLLHVAVSDVSDDVRRAAVTALGFLLFNTPQQCPKVVSLLAESYNPHVRYGACLALGISCAGTGLKSAVDLLEPLLSDAVDFVRQGALVSMAMIMIQQTKAQNSKVEQIRKFFEEKISDKHEDVMCKFGAILACGIIDAGGRNVTISLQSRSGHNNLNSIVGLALFTQFWYWYPLLYFVSLAFTPTALIGLNKDLKMPVYKFKSNARPSMFGYPPETKPPTQEAPKKVKSAILSITEKKKQREKKLEEQQKKDQMEIEKEEKKKKEEEQKKKEEPEPEFEIKHNPARVKLEQIKHLSFDVDERYKPIQEGEVFGIVMLKDTKPSLPEELVTPTGKTSKTSTSTTETKEEQAEPEPPEPFEYDASQN